MKLNIYCSFIKFQEIITEITLWYQKLSPTLLMQTIFQKVFFFFAEKYIFEN